METLLTFIICIVVSIIVTAILNRTCGFNSNVDSPKGISIPEFEVIEISKHYSTDFRTIAKYTVVNSYFKRKKARRFVYRKYKFYDEPGKYKIGDKLTLQ